MSWILHSDDAIHPGEDYSPDEIDFMLWMERYKRTRGRKFPAWSEVLAVLRSRGWRRVAKPGPLPDYPLKQREQA
jgi:hypothetical protein